MTMTNKILSHQINQILPQTQCRECGYPDCSSYADALSSSINTEENIGLCAPGGIKVLEDIATLLQRDTEYYREETLNRYREPALVKIREEECIGCTKCIQACPVDAIIGTAKQMHAIIADECTGCGLCIEPCPVDCIDWIPLKKPAYDPLVAQTRYEHKQSRLKSKEHESAQQFQQLQKEDTQSILDRIKAKKLTL